MFWSAVQLHQAERTDLRSTHLLISTRGDVLKPTVDFNLSQRIKMKERESKVEEMTNATIRSTRKARGVRERERERERERKRKRGM